LPQRGTKPAEKPAARPAESRRSEQRRSETYVPTISAMRSISAGTLVAAADKLVERGATSVMAMVTHGVFSLGAKAKIDGSSIQKLLITDTIETQPETLSSKVEVVSVAPLFGEAIRRIHDRQSISVLFKKTT